MDGEHGGLTLGIPGHVWPSTAINPHGAVKDRAALNDGYVANTAVLQDKGPGIGVSGSVHTQITDVEGEHNGLFTYDRNVEKVDESKVCGRSARPRSAPTDRPEHSCRAALPFQLIADRAPSVRSHYGATA